MQHKYNGINYNLNEKYSFKVFTNHDLSSQKDIYGVIYGSSFYNEILDSNIFPSDMKGVTFIKCNLSNLVIPEGNTVIDCITTRFKNQNDLRDWEVDSDNNPVRVLNEKYWTDSGYSVDPLDIPTKKINDIREIKKVV